MHSALAGRHMQRRRGGGPGPPPAPGHHAPAALRAVAHGPDLHQLPGQHHGGPPARRLELPTQPSLTQRPGQPHHRPPAARLLGAHRPRHPQPCLQPPHRQHPRRLARRPHAPHAPVPQRQHRHVRPAASRLGQQQHLPAALRLQHRPQRHLPLAASLPSATPFAPTPSALRRRLALRPAFRHHQLARAAGLAAQHGPMRPGTHLGGRHVLWSPCRTHQLGSRGVRLVRHATG